jgi:hypothetical protein
VSAVSRTLPSIPVWKGHGALGSALRSTTEYIQVDTNIYQGNSVRRVASTAFLQRSTFAAVVDMCRCV